MSYPIFCAGFVAIATALSILFFAWNRALESRDSILSPTIELFISVWVGCAYSLAFVWLSTEWSDLARIGIGAVLGIFVGWALMMTAGLLQAAIHWISRLVRFIREV